MSPTLGIGNKTTSENESTDSEESRYRCVMFLYIPTKWISPTLKQSKQVSKWLNILPNHNQTETKSLNLKTKNKNSKP